MKYNDYEISWDISLYALSHLHAASLALEIMQDPGSLAKCFKVTDLRDGDYGTVTRVDLDNITDNEGVLLQKIDQLEDVQVALNEAELARDVAVGDVAKLEKTLRAVEAELKAIKEQVQEDSCQK